MSSTTTTRWMSSLDSNQSIGHGAREGSIPSTDSNLLNTTQMTEQEYNRLPQAIKNIVDTWSENLYTECKRIQQELQVQGWTCDYDLNGELFDLKQIKDESK